MHCYFIHLIGDSDLQIITILKGHYLNFKNYKKNEKYITIQITKNYKDQNKKSKL